MKAKQLVLIRHAKSDWADPSLPDRERPLNERGKRDAPFMAGWLKDIVKGTDILIASSAKRAQQTAKYFIEKLEPHSAQTSDSLYDADIEDIISVIKSISPSISCAVIVGHNPGLTQAAEYLTSSLLHNIPTCGVVVMNLIVDEWDDVGRGTASVKVFGKPKELK